VGQTHPARHVPHARTAVHVFANFGPYLLVKTHRKRAECRSSG
jgi:hypothetical protein